MSPLGVIPLSVLLNFNRVKSLTALSKSADVETWVRGALDASEVVEVVQDGVRKKSGWEYWVLKKDGENGEDRRSDMPTRI